MTHPILERYATDLPAYETLCIDVRKRLQDAFRDAGILVSIEGRAKEPDSLVKKCVGRGLTYEEVNDKAGVRVLLVYPDDRGAAEACIRAAFDHIEEIDDKAVKLKPHEFRYNALHFSVRTEPTGLLCEVQLHTPGLAVWSKLSHDLTYKAPPDLPPDATRSINRLMALCEIIDLEAARVRQTIQNLPTAHQSRVLLTLERLFYRVVPEPYDTRLSLTLLGDFLPVVPGPDRSGLIGALEAFYDLRQAQLAWVFENRRDPIRRPLLLQPESILIFYLLEKDRLELEDHWPATRLTESDLDMYKTAWLGLPIDEQQPSTA